MEVGGGIGMGNTCKPMAVSYQSMTKTTTNKNYKKKKKQMVGDAEMETFSKMNIKAMLNMNYNDTLNALKC